MRLESLEIRDLLAANTLDFVDNLEIGSPGEKRDLQLEVDPMSGSAIVALRIHGTSGNLDPAIPLVFIQDTDRNIPANHVPLIQSMANANGTLDSVVMFEVSAGQNFTIEVGGTSGSGGFLAEVMLFGSTNNDGIVTELEYMQAVAAELQARGAGNHNTAAYFQSVYGINFNQSQYNVAFDANLNGKIDGFEVGYIEGNMGGPKVILDLIGDNEAPAVQAAVSIETGSSNTDNITSNTTGITGKVTDFSKIVSAEVSIQGGTGGSIDLADTMSPPSISSLTQTDNEINFTLDISDLDLLLGSGTVLNTGSYTLLITTEDELGNTSITPFSLVFEFDTLAPLAPATPDMIAASDSGTSSTDNLTNITTPTFTLTAEANSTVTFFSNLSGTPLGTAVADGSGNVSFTVPMGAGLAEGTHLITAKATDTAGNISAASTALSIVIDTIDPADVSAIVQTNNPTNPNLTPETKATFTGTTEANAIVTILDSNSSVIATTSADGSGAFAFVLGDNIALALGENSFSFVATDAAGNQSDPTPFTVFRNTAPTIDAGIFSVDENAANGTAVGTVTADSQDGVTDTLTYAITGIDSGFAGTFAINSTTGAITVANSANLNFENKTSFSLTIQVTDSKGDGLGGAGLVTTQNIMINVNNVNEAPVITNGTTTFSIREDDTDGKAVGTVTITDPDTTVSDTFTYEIVSGDPDGVFAIDSSGNITINDDTTIDFETTQSYNLVVKVTDNGGPTQGSNLLSVTKAFTVNVLDVNEAPTITSGSSFGIAENSANGTIVTTVAATDVDEDDPPFLFEITGGTGASVFAIDSATGEVTVSDSAALDYEGGTTQYTLDIKVTDNLNGNNLGEVGVVEFDTITLTINVIDVNEAPTPVPGATLQIDENAAAATAVTTDGTIVATLNPYFTDVDFGDTHTFSIAGGNNGAFAISGNNIVVADSSKLNFETTPSFTLTIVATDSGGLTAQQDVTIDLVNLNELPIIPGGTVSFPNVSLLEVDEAGDISTFTRNLNLTDPEGNTLTFSGDSMSVVAAQDVDGFFQLNTDGSISLLQVISQGDLDMNGERTFTITFYMDDNNSLLTDDPNINRGPFTLTLKVTDNEAPVFTSPAGNSFTIEENVDGSIIDGASLSPSVIVSATDAENDAITFSLAANSSYPDTRLVGLFELVLVDDMGTGDPNDDTYELVVANAADLTFDNVVAWGGIGGVFTIDLVATDAVGREAIKTITITVTDENNTPTFVAPAGVNVDEFVESASGSLTTNSGDEVYTLSGAFADIDAAANLTYTIDSAVVTGTAIDISGAFKIENGKIVVDQAQLLNFEGLVPPSITLTITANDNQGEANSTVTGSIDIAINAKNELPIYDTPTDPFEVAFVDVDDEFSGTPIVLGNISEVLTEVDPEGDTINYSQISMGGTGSEYFSLGTDGTISLIQNVPLDMFINQERFFTLTFDYNDGMGGDRLDSNADLNFSPFTLTIRVFQNPPATFDDAGNYDFSIDENTPVSSTPVLTVSATDPDGETVTYSILDITGTFDIDANTGAITIINNAALNREVNASITFTVFAIDAVNNMTPESITVTINDVNEAPVITNNPGPFSIVEDDANGTPVGTVTITDPDTLVSDTFTYEIVGGDPNGVFAIDSSGNITIADASTIDFETTPQYTLEIKVTDNGGPTQGTNKLFDSKSFTINVGDVNEAPEFVGSDFALPIVDEAALTSTEISEGTANTFVKRFDIDVSSFFVDPEGADVLLQVNTAFDGDTPDFTAGGHIISAVFDNVLDQLVVTFEYFGVDQNRAPTEIELIAMEDTVDMLSAATPLNIAVSVTNEKSVDFQFITVLNPTIDSTDGFDGVDFAGLPQATSRFADEQSFFVEIWGTTLVGQNDVKAGNAWIEGFRNVILQMSYRDDLVDLISVVNPKALLGEDGTGMNGSITNFNAFFGVVDLNSEEVLDVEPPFNGFNSIGGDGSYVRLGYLEMRAKAGVSISGVTDLVTIDFNDNETVLTLNGADEADVVSMGNPENTIPRTNDIESTVDLSQITFDSNAVQIVDATKFTVVTGANNSPAVIAVQGAPQVSTIGGLQVIGQGGNGVGNKTSFTGNIFVLFNGSATDPDSFEIIGTELFLVNSGNYKPSAPTVEGGSPGVNSTSAGNFGLEAHQTVDAGGNTVTTDHFVAVRNTAIRIAGSPEVILSGNAFSGNVGFDSSVFGMNVVGGFADVQTKTAFNGAGGNVAERELLAGLSLANNGTESSSIQGNGAGGYVLTLDLNRLLSGVFDVGGSSVPVNLFFDGTVVATAGGAVPLQGTAFAKDGQPLEDGTGVFVTVNKTRTTTDANGQVAELPDSATWASEWDSLWVEVWGNTADAAGVFGGKLDLGYNTSLYTATQIEYASSMSVNQTGSIDDANGLITGLGSQSQQYNLGNGSFVLLGRVKLESLPGDGIDVSVGGDLNAESLGLTVTNTKLMLSGIGEVTPEVTEVADLDVWAVAYDANDDGKIGISDFSKFITAYGKSTLTADNALLAALDFDNDGKVGLTDFSAFIQNYGKNKLTADSIVYPETFTQMWVGKGIELNGPNTVQEVFEKAVSDWQTALGWEDPIDVKLVVKDFGDAQLGEADLLALDENGLPQFGILTIDDDGAGLGWSADLEGGPAEGQYDLYTVILHELGHLYGFMSHYAGFADNVVTDHEGNKIFIGSDFVAVLDDYAYHLDSTEHMGDAMNSTLDPGQRKLISALDVQILQTAYASATAGQTIGSGSPALTAAVTTQAIVEESIAPVVETQNPVAFVFDKVVDVESVSGRTGYEAVISPAVYSELIRNGVRVTTSSSDEVQQQIEQFDSAVATLVIDDASLLLEDSVEGAEYFASEEDSTNVDDLFADWDFNSDLEG